MPQHGFLIIWGSAPTPCLGNFSSPPPWPPSPSSPGLSPPLTAVAMPSIPPWLRMALPPIPWPPTSPCRPSSPLAQLLKVSSTILALQGPWGPLPIDLPSLPPSILSLDPEVPHLTALTCTFNSFTYFSSRAKSWMAPTLCPLQGSPGAGRHLPRKAGILQSCPQWPHLGPACCLWPLSSAGSLRHRTQHSFNLLHTLTSGSQHTTVSRFAEKTEASHQQLPRSLATKPTQQLQPR